MATEERKCIASLREAAERLGKSPTKAEYEELGLTPASATIIRTVGGWNEAKERAGLETNPSTGMRVGPKPEGVELPDGVEWDELSVDQRWHYRNREWNTERTLQRRASLRAWLNEEKAERGCSRCGESDPACLDFHHRDPETKEMAVGTMVTYGFGTESLREEIAKCDVLCANCHSREHGGASGDDDVKAWVREYKRSSAGCQRCETSDPDCLVFHHPGEKRETVATLVADGRPLDEVQSEVDRCVVLCANCHRKEHFEPPQAGE